MKIYLTQILIVLILLLSGCSTEHKLFRLAKDTVTDSNGELNDDMLARAIIYKFPRSTDPSRLAQFFAEGGGFCDQSKATRSICVMSIKKTPNEYILLKIIAEIRGGKISNYQYPPAIAYIIA